MSGPTIEQAIAWNKCGALSCEECIAEDWCKSKNADIVAFVDGILRAVKEAREMHGCHEDGRIHECICDGCARNGCER